MKKKLIPLIGLTLSLAVAGIIMGSTLSGGSGAPARDPAGQIEEPSGNRPPVRSDEGIDPEVCNYVHNISACDGNPTLQDPPLPTYEEWLRDHGTRGSETLLLVDSDQPVDTSDWKLATSIDDIDPNVCNLMHNRAPCTAEELGELGNGPMHGDPTYDEWLSDFGGGKVVTSIDDIDPNVCNLMHNRAPCTAEEPGELGNGPIAVGEYHPGGAVEGKPKGAVEVKPESDCGLTELSVYLSADGEFGCVVVPVIADGGESGIKEQLPVMMLQTPALLVQ